MPMQVFKNQIYAAIYEILKDEKLYHRSIVGHQYSHLTPEGEEALIELINIYAPRVVEKEHKLLTDLAKQMTWDELKK